MERAKPTFSGESLPGHMPDSQLIQLYIDFPDGDRLCGETERAYAKHIKVHDRWREHLKTCDDCKRHLVFWLAEITQILNLGDVTMKIMKEHGA